MSDLTELGRLLDDLTDCLQRLPGGSPERQKARDLFNKVADTLDAELDKKQKPQCCPKKKKKTE